MKILKILGIMLIFLLGFLSANLVSYYFVYGYEIPFSNSWNFTGYHIDSAPYNNVKDDQIEIFEDRVVIYIDNASLSRYAPTGSMKPTLDEYSNGIRIVPENEDDIHVGDIITYKDDNSLIVHRVIDIGEDSKGVYFIPKGDNNTISDGKIRFEDIRYVTIGVIW